MKNILEFLNDIEVLKEYKCQDALLEAWDNLRDYVEENAEEADKLLELADDFKGNFKGLAKLNGEALAISPANIRTILGEVIDELKGEENE